SGRSGLSEFVVIGRAPVEFSLDNSYGMGGDVVRFYGYNFVPGERVNIMWSGDTLMGYVFAGSDGYITGRVRIPVTAYQGVYHIEAQGVTSNDVVATSFDVLWSAMASGTVSPT